MYSLVAEFCTIVGKPDIIFWNRSNFCGSCRVKKHLYKMFPTSEKTELNWWRDGAMPVKFVKVWYLKLSWNWLKHMLRDGAWYEAVRLEIFVHKKRGNFSRKRQCWNRWLVVLISSHVRNCSSVENYSNVWVYIIWNPITIVWGACLGLDNFCVIWQR